ncbi:hypothetical protein GCM10009735_05370 [Actinomadura chokoriensis]
MHEEEFRTRLRRRLGRRFNEGLWSYLQDRGFVEDAISVGGDRGLEVLEHEARTILEAAAPTAEREKGAVSRPEGPTPGQERAWAVSQLVAVSARQDPDVVTFRRNYLGDDLMQWAEVESWIKAQAERDGGRTLDITCAMEAGRVTLEKGGGWLVDPPLARFQGKVSTRFLSYAVPDDDWRRIIPVAAGGVLDRLRVLADSLASYYAWTSGQATTFVLTDLTPQVSTIRARDLGIKWRHGVSHAWARRIVLTIDPMASPEDVVRAFQDVRRREGLDRVRALSPKKARLAAFACAEHRDKPWADRLQLWNDEFPQWAYSHQSNFRRDALKARSRLLYPGE